MTLLFFILSILSFFPLASLAATSAVTLESNQLIDWNEYLERFPHIQVTEKSKENFINNVKYIIEHNSQERSYKLGVTPFMHLSDDEWKSRFTNITRDSTVQGEVFESSSLNLRGTPSSWDWRTSGVTTPVKDQINGDCYQESATATIETAWAIKSGKLLVLSVQQGVDCSKLNHGENGGLQAYSYMYAEKTQMCLESDYPYVGKDGQCHTCTGAVPTLKGYKTVKGEDSMIQAVLITSLGVAIQADQKQFQMYKSGVLDFDCGKDLDHAVTIEGYGTEDGKDYWLVRNSWGKFWGQDGYVKMARGKDLCGISQSVVYPIF